jgi:glycosyltransferase involved in cell wall biosynthesis
MLHAESAIRKSPMGVSVVLCCHDSAGVIAPTVRALAGQQTPKGFPYEVVLVDNNCTDQTVALAKTQWNHPWAKLRVVAEKSPGLAHARARGIEAARYAIIQFVDDDNILSPTWIAKVFDLYRSDPDIGMIGGVNVPLIRGERPVWFDDFQHVYACGPRGDRSGRIRTNLFGAGVSYRRQALQSAFPPGLPLFLVGRTGSRLLRGEDTEIAYRCLLSGWAFYYDASLVLQHHLLGGRLKWRYVCEARRGAGAANIILKIYKNLHEGRLPFTFAQYVGFVWRRWIKPFLSDCRNLRNIRAEGTETSALFHLLVGMVMGLFVFGKSYDRMRGALVRCYGGCLENSYVGHSVYRVTGAVCRHSGLDPESSQPAKTLDSGSSPE